MGRSKSISTSTLPDDMAMTWVASRTSFGEAGLLTGILRPPVIRFACLAATSSMGLPKRAAGSPSVVSRTTASSGSQEALGPALTSGYP